MNTQPVRVRKVSGAAERQIRQRHIQRQKIRRFKRIAVKSIVTFTVACVVLFVIIFVTPIFNVKNVYVQGNNRIGQDSLTQFLADIKGENIFNVSSSDINKKLSQITYVDYAEVSKKYFPPTVTVTVKEKDTCAYYQSGETYYIIDRDCKILEERATPPEGIPLLTTYTDSVTEALKDEKAVDELSKFFEIEKRIDISEEITAVELCEYNEIIFEYDGRLSIICGSGLDMEQKLRLFKATVTNPNLPENAHGTIDLSTTGTAMYKP